MLESIVHPGLLIPAIVALGAVSALIIVFRRRGEMRAAARSHAEREDARARGSDRARLHHPDIDLSRCIGCGLCVAACPEGGVLSLLHGQAVIVHGSRCVGHGRCADACPVGAIALTLGDLSDRDDLPAIDDDLEAVGVPGLYLAGEISGFALVRTAVRHGTAVADAVARRSGNCHGAAANGTATPRPLDLLIVGAGPGGLACALRAKEIGLDALTLDQAENIGGTVATYPRRKMVMTQPVHLPLHGRLQRLTYEKEELMDLWSDVVGAHELHVRTSTRLVELTRTDDGVFKAQTTTGDVLAHNVCLAIGRRGTPRKLGVPGEDLPKVAYALIDAASYRGRNILVVGGGDSAIEAALGLAAQPGNRVTLSYRKKNLFRLKARNEIRIREALADGTVDGLFASVVSVIEPACVTLRIGGADDARDVTLPNDEVFVFAGGVPPFDILRSAGVSFDPLDRPKQAPATSDSDLLLVLACVLLTTGALGWWGLRAGAYYGLPAAVRPAETLHALLRPTGPVGLPPAFLACALMACNLAYLVRRSNRLGRFLPGSLRVWMSVHVLTGILALELILLHAGFTARWSVGGHALAVLAVVVGAGAIGRYLYAFVPRAANGSERGLDEVRSELAAITGEWDRRGRALGEAVREELAGLTTMTRWRTGLAGRIAGLVRGRLRLRRSLKRLRIEGTRAGVPAHELASTIALARRTFRLTVAATHYEEIRAVLSSWRFIHRWLALLMVLLAALHIATAVRFAEMWPFATGATP